MHFFFIMIFCLFLQICFRFDLLLLAELKYLFLMFFECSILFLVCFHELVFNFIESTWIMISVFLLELPKPEAKWGYFPCQSCCYWLKNQLRLLPTSVDTFPSFTMLSDTLSNIFIKSRLCSLLLKKKHIDKLAVIARNLFSFLLTFLWLELLLSRLVIFIDCFFHKFHQLLEEEEEECNNQADLFQDLLLLRFWRWWNWEHDHQNCLSSLIWESLSSSRACENQLLWQFSKGNFLHFILLQGNFSWDVLIILWLSSEIISRISQEIVSGELLLLRQKATVLLWMNLLVELFCFPTSTSFEEVEEYVFSERQTIHQIQFVLLQHPSVFCQNS